MEYAIPEQMDNKDVFVYNDFNSNDKTVSIFKDSDLAIEKSKDPKDCMKLNADNKKIKGYLNGSKALIDQRANELKRLIFFFKFHNPPAKDETTMRL